MGKDVNTCLKVGIAGLVPLYLLIYALCVAVML
jgi:hypothetical protein